ncbi:MAG TPA: YceI family protein [Gemmatimonadaceae bacterium]|nr:YceI family protein [Gemmatimonadaceae bacterium]
MLAAVALALPASLVAQQAAPQGAPQAAPQQAPLPPHGWRFDTGHSAVTFRVRHLGISWVNGRFNTWNGSLVYDPANPTAASVNVRIQTNSIDTESERRDNDIRSGNYLAVDSFPEMTFVSKKVEKVDDTHLKVTGDLTLRGVTREVVLAAEVTGTMPGERTRRIAFTATTTIDRMAYGVSFNRLTEGAQVVGSEIRITIDIEATQPVAAAQ